MSVFAFRGDLRRLSCDAWYLPGDFQFLVAHYWLTGDEEVRAAVMRARSAPPADWAPEGTRVLPLQLDDQRRAVPVLAAIPIAGTDDWEYHRATLRQFVRVARDLPRPAHMQQRPRRLLAVPLIGTGLSAWSLNRDRHLRGLLDALDEETAAADVDVALVLKGEADWSAVQAVRRQRLAERGAPPELQGLDHHAAALAERARRGRLVLLTGAGIGRPAGLPDWKQLLHGLAAPAGIVEPLLSRFVKLDELDQAAIIGTRLGRDRLAEEVARVLVVPHVALGHGLLANLPVRETVTLNYDRLFEQACEAAEAPVSVLPYEAAEDRWLLKLHGDLTPDRPRDIVLTRADYLALGEHRATLTGLVQALLVTRHMLFVGFGLADDHLHAVIHDVRRALGDARTTKLGTALLLEHDELQEELWKRDLDYVPMGGGSPAEAARRLEVFLDHLLLLSTTSDAHLFDPSYAGLLTDDERRLRDVLRGAFEDVVPGGAPAWARVEALLAELGWRRPGR